MPFTIQQVSAVIVVMAWTIILLLAPPGYIDAGPNSNISACHFCDEGVDFSVRNLICCSLTSRCCGPDRI